MKLICFLYESKRQRKSALVQSDVISDMENVDMLLGNYPQKRLENQLEEDLESDELHQDANLNVEDVRS